ncbi:MAG TPA: hypothetical protein VK137_02125, partial [Planctomycetaceae bacterium]|nr:hypothetical protein [Planctomycetaceae bacterium]
MSGSGSSQSQEFLDRTSPEALCCGGDSLCSTESPTTDVAAAVSPREACPPPLQWQQVVAAFREQSEQWHAKTSSGL